MRTLQILNLEKINGGGFKAGFCAGVASADMFIAAAPLAGIAVSLSGWGVAGLVAANGFCAGYWSGKW